MDYMTRDIITTQHNLYQPVSRLAVEWVYNKELKKHDSTP